MVRQKVLFWRGAAVLAGATVGIGFFSLPLVFSCLGWQRALLAFLLAVVITVFLNVLYGRLVLAASGDHQLSGYGRIYLGRRGFVLGALVITISLYGALLAYLVKFGEMMNFFISPVKAPLWAMLFLFFSFGLVRRGIKPIARFSSWLNVGLVLALVGAFFLVFPYFRSHNLLVVGNSKANLLSVLGIFFFSLSGTAVIPEVEEVMRSSREKLIAAIVAGTLMPAGLYLLFMGGMVGVCGTQVGEEAVLCLGRYSSPALFLGSLAMLAALVTSFWSLSFSLREFWHQDVGLSVKAANGLVFLPLLLLYLAGARSFLAILSISGSLSTLFLAWLILESSYRARHRLH